MRILMREHFNRWYRLPPYYISILMIEIPFQAVCATIYLVVSYWLTGQPVETNRIIFFMVVSIAASLTAQAWGFFIGVTTPIKVNLFRIFPFLSRLNTAAVIYTQLWSWSYAMQIIKSQIRVIHSVLLNDLERRLCSSNFFYVLYRSLIYTSLASLLLWALKIAYLLQKLLSTEKIFKIA